MLRRKIYDKMKEWKENSAGKTALMIDGARRVGKSYIAEEFAKNEYRSYLMIDFTLIGDEVRDLFNYELMKLDDFFFMLSELFGVELYEGESLIIFDEVQRFPRAREAIKFLVKDGRYHYIETGSLISIKKNTEDIQIPSEERHIKMHPLDFEEFLWAMGEDRIIDLISDRFYNMKPGGQAIHRKMMNLFRQYMVVGGMPQAVSEFLEKKNIKEVDAIKKDILNLYSEDIIKYAGNDALKVGRIFDEIPSSLSKHETRFKLSSLSTGARYRDYEDAFFWLQDAMTVNMCFNTRDPSIGLKMNRDRVTLKCYLGDTGLLVSNIFGEIGNGDSEVYKKILFDKLEVNMGYILENIVAQIFVASGHPLYFYSNSNRNDSDERMEIDFLLEKDKVTSRHNIIPVEVKSAKRYTIKSLQKFQKKYAEQSDLPVVLHMKDVEMKDNIRYLPVYMAMFL